MIAWNDYETDRRERRLANSQELTGWPLARWILANLLLVTGIMGLIALLLKVIVK